MLRTHTCGELRKEHANKKVTLCGWLHSSREHGNVIFVDLRDRYGITQVVAEEKYKELFRELKRDSVLKIEGKVALKPAPNKKLETGDVELQASDIEVLSHAEALPIDADDPNISEENKLTYRYIDLRRPKMQSHIIIRHKAAMAAREFLSKEGFLEIETPMLIRHTPEGARDFVVPSRLNKGLFYSLPQSPQLYKQILMVSGMDRYFQLARCMRDESNRGDRQPEFTQIDIEMSFGTPEDIYDVHERMMQKIFKEALNKDIKVPFPRLTYKESMERYGSDKPDLRFSLEIKNVTEAMKETEVKAFKENEVVYCLNAEGCAEWSRKKLDKLDELAKTYHTKGIFWLKWGEEGGISKFITDSTELEKITNAKKGDLLIFIADKWVKATTALGHIRNEVANETGIIPKDVFQFAWVTDFPLFEWDEEEKRWSPMHHIFTMPKKEHMEYLDTDPSKVEGHLYDLTMNGFEMGSGSIRIFTKELQSKVLNVIGMTLKDAESKFGFLMEAFRYGAPPHGGFATGFDRLVMLMCGQSDIREVMAFPKNKKQEGMMEESPSEIDPEHRKELGL